jgi:xanthine dehydrogenase accessory factor
MMRRRISYAEFPFQICLHHPDDSVLAVITETDGPAYRPVGAAAVVRDGRMVAGNMSSGCVDRDVALHAMEALRGCKARRLRYGRGSPFFDITLPCGGALEITLLPRPDPSVLQQIDEARQSRCGITLSIAEGGLCVGEGAHDRLHLRLEPDIALHVFGKGPEAETFAAMATAAGYPTQLYAPDEETLQAAQAKGVAAHPLIRGHWPQAARFDPFTAVLLFFHDHEWESPILQAAASSRAFYIGAQGSRLTRQKRDAALAGLGVPEPLIATMRGPIGLIPRARDARTLAISVLAEVVSAAAALTTDETV